MPGEDSLVYNDYRPWPNGARVGSAAIVGHTTSQSTRLWFRTGVTGDFEAIIVELEEARSSGLLSNLRKVPFPLDALPQGTIRTPPFTVSADWTDDSTKVVDVAGLKPDTWYIYALYINTRASEERRIYLGKEDILTFRTMPAEGASAPVSFGLYSCHQPFKIGESKRTEIVNEEMWGVFEEALRRNSGRQARVWGTQPQREDLRFVIGGGDQMYVDSVDTLDIWKLLNNRMRKQGRELLPTEEDMLSWYRDCYRGYWVQRDTQRVFSYYPNYMIWDDHEIHDGWGSHNLSDSKTLRTQFLAGLDEAGLTDEDGRALIARMFSAAQKAYHEYEHSHNPPTPAGRYDYSFVAGNSAFYVQDGRGHRDISRDSYKILGKEQMERMKAWLNNLDPTKIQFVFVVSAVPVFHIRSLFGKKILTSKLGGLKDDLTDSWEHEEHEAERAEFLDALFASAQQGFRVSILSGDVHCAAAFRLTDDSGGTIYQLTSSAITWNVPRPLGLLLRLSVPEEGTTREGYKFERLAFFRDANFAIVKTDPENDRIIFQLYGRQSSQDPVRELEEKFSQAKRRLDAAEVLSNSIARIPLTFT